MPNICKQCEYYKRFSECREKGQCFIKENWYVKTLIATLEYRESQVEILKEMVKTTDEKLQEKL